MDIANVGIKTTIKTNPVKTSCINPVKMKIANSNNIKYQNSDLVEQPSKSFHLTNPSRIACTNAFSFFSIDIVLCQADSLMDGGFQKIVRLHIKEAWESLVTRPTHRGSGIAQLSKRATPKPTPICI